MTEATWLMAKELLGFMGSLFLTLPWLFDFMSRVEVQNLTKIVTGLQSQDKIIRAKVAWIKSPKLRDLSLTFIGLAMISASFGVGFWFSLGKL